MSFWQTTTNGLKCFPAARIGEEWSIQWRRAQGHLTCFILKLFWLQLRHAMALLKNNNVSIACVCFF